MRAVAGESIRSNPARWRGRPAAPPPVERCGRQPRPPVAACPWGELQPFGEHSHPFEERLHPFGGSALPPPAEPSPGPGPRLAPGADSFSPFPPRRSPPVPAPSQRTPCLANRLYFLGRALTVAGRPLAPQRPASFCRRGRRLMAVVNAAGLLIAEPLWSN